MQRIDTPPAGTGTVCLLSEQRSSDVRRPTGGDAPRSPNRRPLAPPPRGPWDPPLGPVPAPRLPPPRPRAAPPSGRDAGRPEASLAPRSRRAGMQRAGPLVHSFPGLLPRAVGSSGKGTEHLPREIWRQRRGLLCVGLHGNAPRTQFLPECSFLEEDFPPNLGL